MPHVRRGARDLPSTRIINGYGPTESTTFACCLSDPEPPSPSRLHVDSDRTADREHARSTSSTGSASRCRSGSPGELYIGGDGLARGYLNDPELTAEKFVPDPFSTEPGGAALPDRRPRPLPPGWSRSSFSGRLDQQVKIRGFRVEPGEVEAVLAGHPAVARAVVMAREDVPGDRRLVAYLTRRDGSRDPLADASAFLASKLPEYMVPSAFIVLGSLPLNATGKVDWRALPRPALELAELGAGGARPQDTLELVLLKIWEDVLGLGSIGLEDDFFELGGHSLLAVRLFADIEKSFGRSLPLATLFQAPTVARLAAKLREEGWAAPWSSLVLIQRGTRERPPFFCIPGVGGNILGLYDLARHLGPDQPVYGLQARGLDGQAEPLTRIRGHRGSPHRGDQDGVAQWPIPPGRVVVGRERGIRDGAPAGSRRRAGRPGRPVRCLRPGAGRSGAVDLHDAALVQGIRHAGRTPRQKSVVGTRAHRLLPRQDADAAAKRSAAGFGKASPPALGAAPNPSPRPSRT